MRAVQDDPRLDLLLSYPGHLGGLASPLKNTFALFLFKVLCPHTATLKGEGIGNST